MKQNLKNSIILGLGIFLLSGCVGYDRVLFITKTNVGLDLDDMPPTAEITIARRELAIAPTYKNTIKGEKTLPLLGSFGLSGDIFNPGISSVFAGGDAAVILATKGDWEEVNSSVCLSEYSDARSPIKWLWHKIIGTTDEEAEADDRTRAFYFATDTSFGLKVGWNGTGGPYPTSLKLGYNRLELASPPIFINKINVEASKTSSKTSGGTQGGIRKPKSPCTGGWEAKVPSFFASLDNQSKFLTFTDSGVTHVQFFATGAVAKAWANRSSIKTVTFKIMAPKAAELEKESND